MHALHKLEGMASFELARDRFIAWVSEFQNLEDKSLTIVFDNNVEPIADKVIGHRVRVIYSSRGFSADGTILQLVRAMPPQARSQVTVVTRDNGLREALFSYHCVLVSPLGFLKEFRMGQAHQNRTAESHTFFYRPFEDYFGEWVGPGVKTTWTLNEGRIG